MYDFMIKRGPLLAFIVGAALSIITVVIIMSTYAEGGDATVEPDFGLNASKVLFVLSALIAVIFPIISALDNPKVLIKTAIGIGAVLLVFFIAYSISDNEVTEVYTKFDVDAADSQLVGGGIIMIYIMAFLSIGGIIFGEISRIIK